MALAKEFYIGNTHIRIFDDYCVKTQEEVDAIVKRCGEIAYRSLVNKKIREEEAAREREEKNKQ